VSNDFPDFVRALPELDLPFTGASGHLLQGVAQQVAFIRFTADTLVPPHSHRAQWEIPIAGEVRLTRGGVERTHGVGQPFYIPAGEEHGAFVRAGYRAIIIFDQRDRYRTR